jgi:hypothetical protein
MVGKKRNAGMTLAENEAMLKATGQYDAVVERLRLKEAERQARATEWRRAEAPLVQELNAAGFAVHSVWDLVNTSAPYPEALPILLEHIQRPYPGRVREGIARAMAVPETKPMYGVLIPLYLAEEDLNAKDGLAVAISAAADDSVIAVVVARARNRRLGPSRLLLLSALERSADPNARAVLSDLRNDPDLKKEIAVILRRLKRKSLKLEKGQPHGDPRS